MGRLWRAPRQRRGCPVKNSPRRPPPASAEERRAALWQLEAAAAVLGPLLGLPAEVVLDVLAGTAGSGEVARRARAGARLQPLVHVHRPVEPFAQVVLGPAL